MQEISQNLGITIPDIKFTGEIIRFGEKDRYWLIGHEFQTAKKNYQVIIYGDWKTGIKYRWANFEPKLQTNQAKAKINAHIESLEEKITKACEDKNKDCQAKWKPKFDNATTGNVHPYLSKKQIDQNYCARLSKGDLLIPIYNDGELWSVQIVYKDPENVGKYLKTFAKGTRVNGSYAQVIPFDIAAAEVIYLAEGFATACSVYMAVNENTMSCFTAGNIKNVVKYIRSINTRCRVVICADDDFETQQKTGKNPGINAAYAAAKEQVNVIVKKPEFKFRIHETDFNDLHCLEGVETVFNQIHTRKGEYVDIEPLGHRANEKFYYFIHQTLTTVELSPTEHTDVRFRSLAPEAYWKNKYCAKMEKICWKTITDQIFSEQRAKGIFNYDNVRGFGIYRDQGKLVVNLGDKLLVDGHETPFSAFKSTHRYQSFPAIEYADGFDPRQLIDAVSMLAFNDPAEAKLLVGWILIANLFNVLDWRPHIWLTGPRGCGKSAIVGFLNDLILHSRLFQNSTASGIRQTLKNGSHVSIIDEAEPDDNGSVSKMKAVIEMIRQCSTGRSASVVRGSVSGDAVEFSTRSIFCLASIQDTLGKASDISRFNVIEFRPVQDATMFRKIQEAFDNIDQVALFFWVIKNAESMLNMARDLRDNWVTAMEPRQADQITPMVGAYLCASGDKDAPDVINSLQNHISTTGEDESEICMESLMARIIDYNDAITVGMALENYTLHERRLAAFGIKKINNQILIAHRNPELKKLMKDQYPEFGKILRRHVLFNGDHVIKLAGQSIRCLRFSTQPSTL